nr:hypothetical protein [Tanacetum cinerariifolium]
MRLIGPTNLGSSLGSFPCTTLLGTKCHRSGRQGSWQRLGPSLTCVLTLNLNADTKYMRASNSTFKRSTMMETLATREYPSLIHTFFLTHTVGDVFLNPEDKALYDEMLRLQARRCRPGRYPIRAFLFDFSRATSRPGFSEIVAEENGK